MIRITELAQEQVARVLREGDLAVDATAGKGRDTLFLARQVGPQGRVYAFDVQREALEKTAALLKGNGLLDRVTLIDEGHERMADHIAAPVAAVMFNLGYLPGGDPTVVTRPETTRCALKASLNLLRPGGAVTLVLYGGHTGGAGEKAAILDYCSNLEGSAYGVIQTRLLNRSGNPPELVVVEKFQKPSGAPAADSGCCGRSFIAAKGRSEENR